MKLALMNFKNLIVPKSSLLVHFIFEWLLSMNYLQLFLCNHYTNKHIIIYIKVENVSTHVNIKRKQRNHFNISFQILNISYIC